MITRLLPADEGGLSDRELLAAYAYPESSRPWSRFNFVATADGAATSGGVSGGLGDSADKRVFTLLRRLADAVVVGAGTVRAEGYAGPLVDSVSQQWRTAHGLAAHPALVIISGSLRLEPDDEILTRSPVRPVILTTQQASATKRSAFAAAADVVVVGESELDVSAALDELHLRGLNRLLCEGGPSVLGTFQASGLLDELCLTVSPLLVGGVQPRIAATQHEHARRELHLEHVLRSGDTLLLRYLNRQSLSESP